MSPDGNGIPGWFIAFLLIAAIFVVIGIAISVWKFSCCDQEG
jgi:hypothetical protein